MKWRIFVLYLILGLIIPFAFSLILGSPEESFELALNFNSIKVFNLGSIKAEILILVLGGMLGGLLNSFAQDGTLELPYVIQHDYPHKNSTSYSLVPGFLGDCLLGLTGAFIAFFLLHESVLPENKQELAYGINLVSLAILGGYSGKVIIEAALGRLLKSEIKKFKEEQEIVAKNVTESKLIEEVNEQISVGLPEDKKADLLSRVQNSSEETKDKVLARIKLIRRAKSGSKINESRALAENMLPIIETLCDSSNNARYWAELGYIYVDLSDWSNAIKALTKAIDIVQNRPKYYLNRALARIKSHDDYDKIIDDLDQAHLLDPNLKFADRAFALWIKENQLELRESGEFHHWLMEILPTETSVNQEFHHHNGTADDVPGSGAIQVFTESPEEKGNEF